MPNWESQNPENAQPPRLCVFRILAPVIILCVRRRFSYTESAKIRKTHNRGGCAFSGFWLSQFGFSLILGFH